MLDIVRNKSKSIFIKLAFAIIIFSFVIGYAMLSAPGGPNESLPTGDAALVNGKSISYNDFQASYGNLYQLYQSVYQDQFTPALERQLKLAEKSINSLIDQTLLQEEAARLSFEVSEKDLVAAIAKVEAFHQNGVFNKDRYLEVLSYQRITAEQFEAMQRAELLTNRVREQLQASVTVNAEDIEVDFRNNNEKVNLNFVSLSPVTFEKKVKVSDEALEAYFAENQEIFRVPDMVSLRYLQFEPHRYLEEVTFDESELVKFHRRHLDRFEILERAKASHILIKLEEGADETTKEKKRALAEKLLAEAKAGKDFSELARINSDDKASAVNGGSLGYFTRGSMVAPFEKAAFSMKPGDISELVETTFGYHIIKLEEYTEPGIRSLEDAMDEVKEGLRIEKSKQVAFERAMDAFNMNRKTGDLQAAAESNELGLKESGLFSREGYIDGIGRNEEIINAALLLEENTLAKPVVTDDGVILFGLKERQPSHIPELADVKDMATAAYRSLEAVKLARAASEKMLADLREGGKLTKLAKKAGFELEETGDFTRTYSPFVPRIGTSEELATATFALTEDQTVIDQVFEIQNRFIIAGIKQRTAADLAQLDEAKREELRKTILSREQDAAVQKRLDELRGEATIEIYPNVQALLEQEK